VTAVTDAAGCTWRLGRQHAIAATGDVCLAAPGDLTVVTALSKPQSFVSIAISGTIMKQAAADLQALRRVPRWRSLQLSDVRLCRELVHYHAILERSVDRGDADSALAELVRLLFSHCVERRGGDPVNAPRASVLRARDYLEEHYQQHLAMHEVANAAGVTRYHLTRIFSAEFGVSPRAYLLHVRLARAKALLAQGASVQQVAADCGFSDQSHFTRHFRNTYGTTPVHYRDTLRAAS
jgi:AraC-like DNA-binding protein